MKILINIVLVLAICALAYLLYANIKDPIEFKAEKERREASVIDKLKQIRNTQELYRNITGEFASTFDTLRQVLRNESFMVVNVSGDPDDPMFDPNDLKYDTLYFPAIDSIKALGYNLDSLEFVPFGNGEKFELQADTLIYQKTKVQVLEVGVPRRVFMGKYADVSYAKYDNMYDPNKRIKFGDMTKPNTSGNWE